MGANCVLLICTLLDEKTLSSYLKICEELNLAAVLNTDEQSITIDQGILHMPAYSIAVLTEVH